MSNITTNSYLEYRVTLLSDPSGEGAGAFSINATGQSVGDSTFFAGGEDAVLWSATGKATVLQDVGGRGFSAARAINDKGQSVGVSNTTEGADAVLWSPTGQATVLQDVGGLGDSAADAINDKGQSVGYSNTAGGGSDAVLWSPSGHATDLGAILGSAWSNTVARGINDAGQVTGYGTYNGKSEAFLLTPSSRWV